MFGLGRNKQIENAANYLRAVLLIPVFGVSGGPRNEHEASWLRLQPYINGFINGVARVNADAARITDTRKKGELVLKIYASLGLRVDIQAVAAMQGSPDFQEGFKNGYEFAILAGENGASFDARSAMHLEQAMDLNLQVFQMREGVL